MIWNVFLVAFCVFVVLKKTEKPLLAAGVYTVLYGLLLLIKP